MKHSYFILISWILLSLSACSNNDIDDTVFIADPENRDLPAYTEWGYNTFGAKYLRNHNKQYFLGIRGGVPCNIKYDKNAGLVYFTLAGSSSSNHWESDSEIKLTFSFPFQELTHYRDLVAWNNMKLDLTAPNCRVKLEHGDVLYENITLEYGFLFFKKVQHLFVDDEEKEIIISGTFELNFTTEEDIVTLSDGRFDVGIGLWNFRK